MRTKTLLLATACAALVAGALSSPAVAASSADSPQSAVPAAVDAPRRSPTPACWSAGRSSTSSAAKVQAGAQPWKTRLRPDDGAAATRRCRRTPKPRAVVECGSYSNPNYGCTDEREDAIAAYTDALAWYITSDGRYAQKAIQLMDAWSATITDHTNSNAPLQTGWAGSSWPRAAEIIKYTYGSWPNSGRFAHDAAQRLPARGHQRLATATATGS